MKISRLPHYVRRLKEVGPTNAFKVVSSRVQHSFFEQYTRYQAEHNRASYTWPVIAQRHSMPEFTQVWSTLKKQSFVVMADMYASECTDQKQLLHDAEKFAHGCFDILGSRDQCLIKMPWHSDFRLRYQNPEADYLFDKNLFYKDISIRPGLTDRLTKDIKVPWELSRFHHLFVIGYAFSKGKDPIYSDSFVHHIEDWIQENPFLLGSNWVCPMDVGIRALNWIWGFHFFKEDPRISVAFWERFTCSLYDHLIYLENNWEVYAVTSNHYLSDLIGYFYLTWFFQSFSGMKSRRDWCVKELLKEFEKQVFEEGTDYEGSTRYHKLVTEIYYHFYLLCQEQNIPLPKRFVDKLKRCFQFLDNCSIGTNYLLKIGDDDSGKLLHFSLPMRLIKEISQSLPENTYHYKDFGISILKIHTLHFTLRHHAYNSLQPSGHFHNDVASITLAVDDIPLIVDPGSYVYTPSAYWRNMFRSAQVHNTFFIEDIEPTELNDRMLFNLTLPNHHEKILSWTAQHHLYSSPARRNIEFKNKYTTICITDQWLETVASGFTTCWNLTLAPNIQTRMEGTSVVLFYKDRELASVASRDLEWSIHKGWYSPGYGTKIVTTTLKAKLALTTEPVTTFLNIL